VERPLKQTWLVAAFGAAACALGAHVGADARWLAAIGHTIFQTHAVPHSIPYASAPALSWHDAPALGQLVFHALEALLGDRGLILAQVVAVAIALSAVAFDLGRAGAREGAGAGVLAACVVAVPASFFVARAELFSLALFPVLVLLLREEHRRISRRIWLVIPLLVLWANLHGGALLGFLVLAAYLVFERAPRDPLGAWFVFLASAAALVATPSLLETVDYYSGVLHGEAAAGHYGLWARLSFSDPLDVVLVAIAVPLVVAALRRRPGAWQVVVLLALCALTVNASSLQRPRRGPSDTRAPSPGSRVDPHSSAFASLLRCSQSAFRGPWRSTARVSPYSGEPQLWRTDPRSSRSRSPPSSSRFVATESGSATRSTRSHSATRFSISTGCAAGRPATGC
jgi:hypothetical protein